MALFSVLGHICELGIKPPLENNRFLLILPNKTRKTLLPNKTNKNVFLAQYFILTVFHKANKSPIRNYVNMCANWILIYFGGQKPPQYQQWGGGGGLTHQELKVTNYVVMILYILRTNSVIISTQYMFHSLLQRFQSFLCVKMAFIKTINDLILFQINLQMVIFR